MGKYTDAQERDAATWRLIERDERDREHFCGGCGLRLEDHEAPQVTCRRLQNLLQLVIDWHLGEVQARAKLQDAADEEIARRQRKP